MDGASERDLGAEISHPVAGELAPHAPINDHIQHYRSINGISLRHMLWTGLPIGLAIGLAETGTLALGLLALPLLVVSVVYGIKIYRERPKLVHSNLTEFKSGDYTTMQMWVPFLPAVGWIATVPIDALGLSTLEIPPVLGGVLSGAFLGFAFSLSSWATLQSSFRIGKRRIKAITEKQSLEGVTEARMEAVEAHGDILGALIVVGAVDGNNIPIKRLRKLLSCDIEDMDNEEKSKSLLTRIKNLQADGVIKISGQGLSQKPESWEVTITPIGIRNLAQRGQR